MKVLKRLRGWFGPRAEVTTARSPAAWFMDIFGGNETDSGVRVSEAVALSLSPYYCGLNMISGTVGTLPLNVYKTDGRKREVWSAHPAHYLLHTSPNPEMTAVSLRQTWQMHAIGRGNCYGEIVWDVRGNPKEIWPLPPTLCSPRRDDTGKLWYEVRPGDKEVRYLDPMNVLHVPGLGFDGIMGYGLIQLAAGSIGLAAAQERYAGRFFKNGGNISGTLEMDGTLSAPAFERLKSEVAQKLQGLSNSHRLAILENGLKFKPMNPTHQEAQLVEARRFTVEEWARWLNMPPHKLREMTHATFSNIEHQNIEWVVDTIRPWLVRFEQEFNRKLFRKQSVFYTKHVVDGLLRGDQKARFDAYAVARNWGWMSANDVLELEDRNPLPGKTGDMYLVPLNMVPAEMAGKAHEAKAAPKPAPEPDANAIRLARAAAERVVRLEARALSTHGDAAYTEVAPKVAEWLSVPQEAADKYCAMARQLNLIAADQEITLDELNMRKADLLEKLALGGLDAD